VLAARDLGSPQAETALAELCRTYWYPLYGFVRRRGHSPHDAQDLTQAFFARLLEKKYYAQADSERGRFRTFLLAALNHFLADEWDKERCLKRGGGRKTISFDAVSAEERYRLEPLDLWDAAQLYERRWVTTLFEKVLIRLEEQFRDSSQTKLFEVLKDSLLAQETGASYAMLGLRLGLTEDAVKKAVQRMRLRYRELFREEVAQTVAGPEELEAELKYFFALVSA
jgi:RNA polymerase sigma-70 factor (ECF subfamily)